MSYETIDLSAAGGVALVTLNRPEAMNALSRRLKEELEDAFENRLAADDDVRVVIVTGVGERAFCAGADLKERSGETPPPAAFFRAQQATHRLFGRIAAFDRPVIAAINGVAFGGGAELALCCDVRLMADTARIGLTEVRLGAIPAGGGTQRLPRLVGASRAKELIFSGSVLTAEEACEAGLASRAVAAAKLMDEARSLADKIAAQPPLAVRFVKRVIDRGLDGPLAAGLEYELYAASILFDTEDRKEGMAAFVEKRLPRFMGA
ncbi:MAG: enoyl-CoA hydratase-related protein [Rhodospirillaceae bacterium]|nr:enoyl-CoA hydratase-related protein [Rhodospirillaceae bacterium]